MSGNSSKKKRTMSESLSDDEHIEHPCFSLATLGLRPIGTEPPPKPQPPFPKQTLNARGMPARIRRRNRFFFDDNIINDDKPLRVSLSPRKTPLKASSTSGQQQPVQYIPKTPSKLLKNQKSLPKCKKESYDTKAIMKGNKNAINYVDEEITNATLRFRNILKLPKPHIWISNEFFTSFIDEPLLEIENEFQSCLKHETPQFHDRNLTRSEWIFLRSMMGKPRRCSARFFNQERQCLENKRKKIRYLQSNRSVDPKDINLIRGLPDKIPLPLPLGTKVQARLFGALQNGVQYGTVEAFNSQSSTYRVTFERLLTDKYTIHDIDIKSENFFEMLPLQSISKEYRTFNSTSGGSAIGEIPTPIRMDMRGLRSALSMNLNKSDPLLGQEVYDTPYKNPVLQRDNLNGRSIALLEFMVRLRHALANKRAKLQRLSVMNYEAEMRVMTKNENAGNDNGLQKYSNGSSDESVHNMETASNNGSQLTEDFQRRYASIVISMERVNRDIQDYLYEVQKMSCELTRDPQEQAMLVPTYLREKCREESEFYVNSNNHSGVKNPHALNLIKNLTTILVVASHLGSNDANSAQVPKVLEGCMEEVKSSLYTNNVNTFQKNVQLHLHHIRLGIGQNALLGGANTSMQKETFHSSS